MAGAADDQLEAADYVYQDDLYLERPDERFTCPVCLCPVQRQAYLTECCGRHFCKACIARLRNERKPCPMCKKTPLAIFPNKERQREIKQIRVRCPLSLAQYRDVIGGRGPLGSAAIEDDSALSDQVDAKITEECGVQNKGGFCNKTDDSDVTILSTVVDELKLNDNDQCTEHQTLSKIEVNEKQVIENIRPDSDDRTKDSIAVICNWTGELGQIENHVSEIHGADALKRIKNDEDIQPTTQGQCAHDHHHHHHHHHNISIHPSHPQNVTFHYVRGPHGEVNFHYHVHRSRPFNVSNTAPAASNVVGDSHITSATNQQPSSGVGQGSDSTSGDFQGTAPGGNGLHHSQDIINTPTCSTAPNSQADLEACTGLQPRILVPTSYQVSSNQVQSSPHDTVPARGESRTEQNQQQTNGDPSQSRPEMIAQQPSPRGAHRLLYPLDPGPPLHLRPQSCPHHHVRGVRGHRHHHHHHGGGMHRHHFHHRPPPHHGQFHPHDRPPPPPPHGPPHPHHPHPHDWPHHRPPLRGFPPGPGRGGHHHRHHPHGRHHRCHGHHHHPPPH